MQRSGVGVWKLLALGVVVLLVQAHAASLVVNAAGQGRDLSGCVQACNAFKATCGDTCQDDCGVFFPRGSMDFNTCVTACQEECAVEMQECKKKCNANHEPPTVIEP